MELRNTYSSISIHVKCFMFLYSCLIETVRRPRYWHKYLNNEIRELHCQRLLRQCDSNRTSLMTERTNIMDTNILITDSIGEEGRGSKFGMLYINQRNGLWVYKNQNQFHKIYKATKFIKSLNHKLYE